MTSSYTRCVLLLGLVIQIMGCASVERANQVDRATNTFVNLWSIGNFHAMYDGLHPAFQRKVPYHSFQTALIDIQQSVGNLKSCTRMPSMWRPPLLDEANFKDPLASEETLVISQFHVVFEHSEGYLTLESSRQQNMIRIAGLGLDIPEIRRPPLNEQLRRLGIGGQAESEN